MLSPQHESLPSPALSLSCCEQKAYALTAGCGKVFTDEDIRNFELLPTLPGGALEKLATSLAPSIYGHHIVKKGLVLQLLGGRERILANGADCTAAVRSFLPFMDAGWNAH